MSLEKKMARSEAGIILLELMIAAGVMLGAVVLIIGSLLSVWDVIIISEQRASTYSEVSTVLEELRSLTFDEILQYDPELLNSTANIEEVRLAFLDADGVLISLPVQEEIDVDALPNPVEISLTLVQLDRKGHALTQTASTLVRR